MKTHEKDTHSNYTVVTDRLDSDFSEYEGEPVVLRKSGSIKVYVIYSGLTYRQAILKKASLNGLNFGNVWIERADP